MHFCEEEASFIHSFRDPVLLCACNLPQALASFLFFHPRAGFSHGDIKLWPDAEV